MKAQNTKAQATTLARNLFGKKAAVRVTDAVLHANGRYTVSFLICGKKVATVSAIDDRDAYSYIKESIIEAKQLWDTVWSRNLTIVGNRG